MKWECDVRLPVVRSGQDPPGPTHGHPGRVHYASRTVASSTQVM